MLFAARAQRGALRIRIEDERHGRARLAVAACDEVIAALVEASRAAGWRIASFHDALSASLGAHAVELSADDFGFVLRQPRVVTCIFRRSGEWRDVVTLPRVGERAADWFAAAALLAGQPPSVDAYEGQFDGTTFSAGDDAGAPPRIAQTDLTAWPEPTAPTALTEPTTASAEAPA
ncbi:hypothetical protein XM57_25455 [Burkholderia cepacia]|nr:hypothetical protein XM57_25455 [Burkholderia cepacia]EAY70537.1 hypothetical protein BDAG_03337 [Burkholderia dolosa AU0158]ETP62539.1 hypothetical protein BDSB_19515 [Burkholderia dolosa PC543]